MLIGERRVWDKRPSGPESRNTTALTRRSLSFLAGRGADSRFGQRLSRGRIAPLPQDHHWPLHPPPSIDAAWRWPRYDDYLKAAASVGRAIVTSRHQRVIPAVRP